MTEFYGIFEYWSQYRVLYCPSCRFCPVPQHVETHLSKRHPQIPSATRQKIVLAVRSHTEVARCPGNVVYPEPHIAAIDGLPIHDNALACRGVGDDGIPCVFSCTDMSYMHRHCKKRHRWGNQQRRGGDARRKQHHTPNRMWEEAVSCQRFFRTGKWQRWFEVHSEHQTQDAVPDDEWLRRGEQMLVVFQRDVIQQAQANKVDPGGHRYVANAWLERTGWAPHLSQYSPDELFELVRWPQRDDVVEESAARPQYGVGRSGPAVATSTSIPGEPALWRACQFTVRLIREAQKTCRPQVVGGPALEYINRREVGQDSNNRPFYGRQMGKTITKYSRHMCRILCYLWRTHDVADSPPPYRLLPQQRQCLVALQEAVDQYEEHASPAHARQLLTACLYWWIALVDHQLGDNEHISGLISGAAVLGWNSVSQVWKTPINYPPTLSAIITVYRMLVVHHAHQKRERDIQRRQEEGMSEVDAHEHASSHFALVQGMVHRFMTMTDFGG